MKISHLTFVLMISMAVFAASAVYFTTLSVRSANDVRVAYTARIGYDAGLSDMYSTVYRQFYLLHNFVVVGLHDYDRAQASYMGRYTAELAADIFNRGRRVFLDSPNTTDAEHALLNRMLSNHQRFLEYNWQSVEILAEDFEANWMTAVGILHSVSYSQIFMDLDDMIVEIARLVDTRSDLVINAALASQHRYNTLALVSVLTLALSGLFALVIIRKKLKPMDLLVRAFQTASTGNLTSSLPEGGKDEIAQVSQAFNRTMEEFRTVVSSILKAAKELSSSGGELSNGMSETAAAVNEIAANIQSIKVRITNQSASVNQTHATMEQLVGNINKLSDHIESQVGYVSKASASVEEMIANTKSVTETLFKNAVNVNTLTEASEAGRGSLSTVSADIREIARESEGLLEINAVMEDIAGQTNLLSMNAAIQAAQAGEAGKGFAVVAGEIRKLAENSGKQSKTIVTVLKKITDSINKITKSTEKVQNKFEDIDMSVKVVADQEENIRGAMEEQGEGSKQILDGIANMNDITRSVRSDSQEMFSGAKEVIQESRQLEEVTAEITNGMNEIVIGTDRINAAVHNVEAMSVKNREMIELLIKQVSRFKV